jgi:pilus assembly protein CpaF
MSDPLLELVYDHPELADLDAAARREAIEELLRPIEGDAAPAAAERVARSIDGFGPLTELLEDDTITDVLINGGDEVWIERGGRLERIDLALEAGELDALIERLIADGGGRVDALHPIADVRLGNGDRMHVVAAPIAARGPVVSIRRFPKSAATLDDLVAAGTIARRHADALAEQVIARASIVVSGATGVGKTTMLGALLTLVGSERIVTIEETRELHPRLLHAVHLATREANVESAGAVSSSELVRAALRMRPDRIVIGEVRGIEAADALWAMSTGHAGSMLTVHARGPRHVPFVLGTLAAGPSVASVPELAGRFAEMIDVIVHLERVGARRVVTGLQMP